MTLVSPEAQQAMWRAAYRLHHLSMRYVGALAEVASGKPIGLLLKDHPGLHEMRDLIDLVLFCRAEINAFTKLLLDAKLIDAEKFVRQQAEEYEYFAKVKAAWLGVEISDVGLVFKSPPEPPRTPDHN